MILGTIVLVRAVMSLKTGDGATYATHEIIGNKPRSQKTGTEATPMTLGCKLYQELLDIDSTLAQLRSYIASGEIVPLQEPNGYLWGSFYVKSISVSPTAKLPEGVILACDLDIELGDPGETRGVVPVAKEVAVAGAVTPSRTALPEEDRSEPAGDVDPRSIARLQ